MEMTLNGCVMSRDRVVAKVKNGLLTDVKEALLPLYLKKTQDLEAWLRGRAIDSHRTNSRLLKRALRLQNADDLDAVLRVHAATITDGYWFRQDGETLTYEDIRFKQNLFDKLALFGDPDSFNNPYSPTPELTNIGSYEKCWRLLDGKWWMYKSGTDLEYFSELFICRFGQALGFSMARYEMDGRYIRSLDFTDGAAVYFEAADGLVLKDEDYSVNFHALRALSEDVARQYLQMLYLDTLCFNMDRHTKNYGVLREAESGQILSLAPLFDHNIALISRGYPQNTQRRNDRLISLLLEFLNHMPEAARMWADMAWPEVDAPLILRCVEQVPVPADTDFLTRFILNADDEIRQATGMEERQGQDLSL